METGIAEGKIGAVGAYDLEFKGGKLVGVAKAGAAEVGLTVEVQVALEAHAVLAAIKKAIPGQIDDALLGLLEQALLA